MTTVPDWFDRPDPTGATSTGERGLRFTCTQCGACCTGPSGYVSFTPTEAKTIARRLAITPDEFIKSYTTDTPMGPSFIERRTEFGFDCVFLDRETIPGRAICSIYEDRPSQCRTWPFWEGNLRSPNHWKVAGRTCPGIDKGRLHSPETIRLTLRGGEV
ncbi:MAG: YkgJ family cysteine cluster protein [Phycisphaerales bacterium]